METRDRTSHKSGGEDHQTSCKLQKSELPPLVPREFGGKLAPSPFNDLKMQW